MTIGSAQAPSSGAADAGPPVTPQTAPPAGRSPWQLARKRLLSDRFTVAMLVIAVLAVLLAAAAPLLVRAGVLDPFGYHPELIDADTGGLPNAAGGASLAHPFGVEPGTGRDVFSRVVLGVTTSLTIALSASLIAVVIGTSIGIISGFTGGGVDFWFNRLIDMVLSFPQTLMLLALSGMFIQVIVDAGVPAGDLANGVYVTLVLGLFGWPVVARVIRGQVLSLREREFVEAARSLGARNGHIYVKELLPNLWAPVLIYLTLLLPLYVSAEAALSFLSVGIKPPTPTLGNVLTDSVAYSTSVPLYFFAPAVTIAVIVLAFNLLGDGLRDALDPKADR